MHCKYVWQGDSDKVSKVGLAERSENTGIAFSALSFCQAHLSSRFPPAVNIKCVMVFVILFLETFWTRPSTLHIICGLQWIEMCIVQLYLQCKWKLLTVYNSKNLQQFFWGSDRDFSGNSSQLAETTIPYQVICYLFYNWGVMYLSDSKNKWISLFLPKLWLLIILQSSKCVPRSNQFKQFDFWDEKVSKLGNCNILFHWDLK